MAANEMPEELRGTLADEAMQETDKFIAAMREIGERPGTPQELAQLGLTTQAKAFSLIGRLAVEVHELRKRVSALGS